MKRSCTPRGVVRIPNPVCDLRCQVDGALGRIVFGQHVVAPDEQPIDVCDAAGARINADEGALAVGGLQHERLLSRHH